MNRNRVSVCRCADHGCPVHPGQDCQRVGTREMPVTVLYRVDMEDYTGTTFCPRCAEDAMESGLFTDERGKS